jgi:clan AA aspartic protease (TIGR02281 family)
MIPIEILKIKDDLRDGYHVLCRVHINDKEFRMLIDTGASMTVFDIKKAKEVSLNEAEDNKQKIYTVGNNSMKSKHILIEKIIIGNIVIKDYKSILLDLDDINEHFRSNGEPLIDGIIGGDILFEHNAVIDYENRQMKLS